MKKTLTLLLIICAGVTANAQNLFKPIKKKWTDTANYISLTSQQNITSFSPLPGLIFITDPNGGKSLITLDFKKDGKSVGFNDWDMIQIYIKKSQFHWLNDSTAIYIKPTK